MQTKMALEGAAMQLGMEFGLKGIWETGVFIYKGLSGSDCRKLEQIVNSLSPIVTEICASRSGSLPNPSLEKFSKFREKIAEGNGLIDEYKKSRMPWRRLQINERIKKLEKSINKFIQNDLQIVMLHVQVYISSLQVGMVKAQVSLSNQLGNVSQRVETVHGQMQTVCKEVGSVREKLETLCVGVETVDVEVKSVGVAVDTVGVAVETGVRSLHQEVGTLHQEVKNLTSKFEEQQIEKSQHDESLCCPPDTPAGFLGFDKHIMNLMKLLLTDAVNVVGVTAMGGAGKSTLAKAICKNNEIKEHFKGRIIYIVASERPDLLSILKDMWRNIVGGSEPHFTNAEDAHNRLQLQIKSRNEPILVVLDDIWSKTHLEKLLFEENQYKTLVTTRDKDVITREPRTRVYELPLLQKKHALKLFCHHAFGQHTIPIGHDKELIMKVQQECNGLPLALKVIGSSLFGEPDSVWERAEKRLSAGEPFKDHHKDSVLNTLKTSIDGLDENEKRCFLDLGAFPQRKDIPARALLDIWVYVRRMNSDRAEMLLWKFADRHLLDLKKNPGTAENTDDCMDVYSFSQHDVMRDLALYLVNQDNNPQCRRLYMPKMENCLPPEWVIDKVCSSKAQIVSIHTGAMKESDWPKMEFPEVEALILYFTASEYCIPTFLHTMKNLKVLIIQNNDGAKRSKLSGLAAFEELSQLKALHLEKLIVPEECKVLRSLEKINMSLCEGLGRDKMFNFPELLDFNVSYCIDLEELPAGLCSSKSLKTLSVTHCHRLAKLPDELDELKSVKEVRLCESLGLEALPPSICRLEKLKLLDISSCIHLKVKRGEGCELKETLQNLAELASLKRVICDKKNEWLFKKSSRTDLKVQAVEEKEANLDWLDWEGRKLDF